MGVLFGAASALLGAILVNDMGGYFLAMEQKKFFKLYIFVKTSCKICGEVVVFEKKSQRQNRKIN